MKHVKDDIIHMQSLKALQFSLLLQMANLEALEGSQDRQLEAIYEWLGRRLMLFRLIYEAYSSNQQS
jgi:hypothetical protein